MISSKGHTFLLFFILILTGCHSQHTESPPLHLDYPQEISAAKVKGLKFVNTLTFRGLNAELLVRKYATAHHCRYYVVVMYSSEFKDRPERITAMFYR